MTIIIQFIIILAALVVIKTALGNRTSHVGRAYKKLSLVVLALGMILVVIFPGTTNVVAHAVGVGRGADLLLYVTVVAFILYVLNNYLQMQDQRDMLFRIARRVAILEAQSSKKARK